MERTFRFASQVKALVAGGAVANAVDTAGLVGFCLFGSVPEPFTIRRAISALPAGSTLTVSTEGASGPKTYFSASSIPTEALTAGTSLAPADWQGLADSSLRESVSSHLLADVPVGIFLSAGINSSAIAGLAAERSGRVVGAVTLAFDEFEGTTADEAPLAAEVACRATAREHTTRVVRASASSEYDLPKSSMRWISRQSTA